MATVDETTWWNYMVNEAKKRNVIAEWVQWIPVEERLPETPQPPEPGAITAVKVLAVVGGRVIVATCFSDGEWWEGDGDRQLRPDETVTHWAAMPRGPKTATPT